MTNDLQQARIEAAKHALLQVGAGRFGLSVVEHGMSISDAYEELARAALAAADAHLPTVDQIETRIKEAEHDWRNAEFVGDPDLGTLTKYVAHAIRALFGEAADDD